MSESVYSKDQEEVDHVPCVHLCIQWFFRVLQNPKVLLFKLALGGGGGVQVCRVSKDKMHSGLRKACAIYYVQRISV